jgi:NAD(P)-dependent dehydrogenase (short-subunit alcohol dehydrogenase family)
VVYGRRVHAGHTKGWRVVTGAAGGIGAALAERLLQAGALVPISDLDGSQLEELAARTARTTWRKLAPIGEALRTAGRSS